MSLNELCPVRPGDQESGEGPFADQEDHQDRAYRNAWKRFDPDEEGEEEEQSREPESDEGNGMYDAREQEGEGQRSKATAVPKAPTARE